MARHKVYREGKLHVCARQCDTCIFRPGNLMNLEPGRVKQMVATANDSCIPCHHSIYDEGKEPAVCRGFFDLKPNLPIRLAIALNIVEEVEP